MALATEDIETIAFLKV